MPWGQRGGPGLGPALGTEVGVTTRKRGWGGAGGAIQDTAGLSPGKQVDGVGFPRGRGRGRGLSHSLRRLALRSDEARLHKGDLARGRVPAQAPGQAGHLGAQDLDMVTASEGHLFGP